MSQTANKTLWQKVWPPIQVALGLFSIGGFMDTLDGWKDIFEGIYSYIEFAYPYFVPILSMIEKVFDLWHQILQKVFDYFLLDFSPTFQSFVFVYAFLGIQLAGLGLIRGPGIVAYLIEAVRLHNFPRLIWFMVRREKTDDPGRELFFTLLFVFGLINAAVAWILMGFSAYFLYVQDYPWLAFTVFLQLMYPMLFNNITAVMYVIGLASARTRETLSRFPGYYKSLVLTGILIVIFTVDMIYVTLYL